MTAMVQLFEEKDHQIEHLLKALEEAIDLYQETLQAKQARDAKMAELQALGELGGVKGMRAKVRLWLLNEMVAAEVVGDTTITMEVSCSNSHPMC